LAFICCPVGSLKDSGREAIAIVRQETIEVSVCLAAYNGARYIAEQLSSILAQLSATDELVIVNDASSDETRKIVQAFMTRDTRIRLLENETNQGVRASFEKALRAAHGAIICLSDQDDVWLPGKLAAIHQVFDRYPDITLVASDAQVISGAGALVSESFFTGRGKFRGGFLSTLIKNKYLGCTMAFRRKMLAYYLPLPADIPMHDIWIGMVNSIYGKAYYIDRPLIAYRRHNANVSPSAHGSVKQMAIWRWQLLKNLARRALSKKALPSSMAANNEY
jgi:glycosyltransferase involved in cell wall biosynthesis